jgi:hypothetical protein
MDIFLRALRINHRDGRAIVASFTHLMKAEFA